MTDHQNSSAATADDVIRGIETLITVIEAVRGERGLLRVSGNKGDPQDVGVMGIDNFNDLMRQAVAVLSSTPAQPAPQELFNRIATITIDDQRHRNSELQQVLVAGYVALKWALPLQGAVETIEAIAALVNSASAPCSSQNTAESSPPVMSGDAGADTQCSAGNADDDPTASEPWNLGCDFAMMQLCKFLGVEPTTVSWDAATETLDGDVQAVIGNILRAKFGEDWGPDVTPTEPQEAPLTQQDVADVIAWAKEHDLPVPLALFAHFKMSRGASPLPRPELGGK